MYFGDHRKDLGLLATSFVHLVPIQRLFVRVVPIQHLFPCDHNPQSRGITGLLDMKRLLFALSLKRRTGHSVNPQPFDWLVCVFITAGPFTKLCAWGRRRVEDMCYEIRRAEACVD